MTTNRLAKSETFQSKFTAAEWAALAREKRLMNHANAWDQRAAELGEERIPNGITVRLKKDGSKERVWITEAKS
jgi:hypothetical protein